MKNLITIFCLSAMLFSGCTPKIAMNANYFKENSKVGILINTNKIGKFSSGSQGLLDMALTPGDKYKEPLQIIDSTIIPTEKLEKIYTEIFKVKGKTVILLDEKFDKETTQKFSKPTSEKQFHKYDFRYLKEKHQIDELVFVDINYGILVEYYGVIETGRKGYADLKTAVIDLKDNAYLYSQVSTAKKPIVGKWKNPPHYEGLKTAIEDALNEVSLAEKSKF